MRESQRKRGQAAYVCGGDEVLIHYKRPKKCLHENLNNEMIVEARDRDRG